MREVAVPQPDHEWPRVLPDKADELIDQQCHKVPPRSPAASPCAPSPARSHTATKPDGISQMAYSAKNVAIASGTGQVPAAR